MGRSTDDLRSLHEALETLKVHTDGGAGEKLHGLLGAKLREESEEDDAPGEFGHDFQGGAVGF